MDPALTSTTFEIYGHRIVRQLGVVRGITVRFAGWWASSRPGCAASRAARSMST